MVFQTKLHTYVDTPVNDIVPRNDRSNNDCHVGQPTIPRRAVSPFVGKQLFNKLTNLGHEAYREAPRVFDSWPATL